MANDAATACYHDVMARTITLRLSDEAYDAVRRWADSDSTSMNAWIEGVLDSEDMRRRCAAHDQHLSGHPEHVAVIESWADRNLSELSGR